MSAIHRKGNVAHNFEDARLHLIAEIRRRSIESMSLEAGVCVLDVGCGTGAGTLALAAAVGWSGVARGVDYDASMIAEARHRARQENVDSRVFYHQANAIALPWPDGYFNASRSDCVLHQMLEPISAFDELVRVTRPGGRVVVIDGDWETLGVDSDDPDIGARLPYFQATLRSHHPRSGQCLRELFARAGLRDVTLDVQAVFKPDTDAAWCWKQSLTLNAAGDGRYASANVLIMSGCKP